MRYCCDKCFYNIDIKRYIENQNNFGQCDYCNEKDVHIMGVEELGRYFRECFDKAYESLDTGTGAFYDSEDKEYYGPKWERAIRYSIYDILEDEEVFENGVNEELIEDIIKYSGPDYREIKHGAFDPYGDIYEECFVIKNDLYGVYGTQAYMSWEHFKFNVKHYNRFFDVNGYLNNRDMRKDLLENIKSLIVEYEHIIPADTIFYRARSDKTLDFDSLIIDKELSPAPPRHAQTNRMSPAGISYLYLASSKDTACKECKYNDVDVFIAEYQNKNELQIIDFSKNIKLPTLSIFNDEYEHDLKWHNTFLKRFTDEISAATDNENKDHSYEYVATQLVAEYIRLLGYDGIGFNSSTGTGKSYCFFCGPIIEYCKYDYGLYDDIEYDDILPPFNEFFNISEISLYHVSASGELKYLNKSRCNLKDKEGYVYDS